MILSNKRLIKVLIRLRGCSCWSVPLIVDRFSSVEAHIMPSMQSLHYVELSMRFFEAVKVALFSHTFSLVDTYAMTTESIPLKSFNSIILIIYSTSSKGFIE